MIVCIITDVHSNWEALQAVDAAAFRLAPERVICLGDLVGYNADPDACMEWASSRVSDVIRGNHDKAVSGLLPLDWFNPVARQAALWTRKAMSPDTLSRLTVLPGGPQEPVPGVVMCHGTPMDEDRYMIEKGSIGESFAFMESRHKGARVCFFGHTHVPMIVRKKAGGRKAETLSVDEETVLEEGWTYLINPGSVGQPRDGNPGATFGILDTKTWSYRMHRVAYDAGETRRKIAAAGLPPQLALRLEGGW